jgi:hypothetical protein
VGIGAKECGAEGGTAGRVNGAGGCEAKNSLPLQETKPQGKATRMVRGDEGSPRRPVSLEWNAGVQNCTDARFGRR